MGSHFIFPVEYVQYELSFCDGVFYPQDFDIIEKIDENSKLCDDVLSKFFTYLP